MLLIKQKLIFRNDLRANPHLLYIFGDNLKRVGLGGQAGEMRNEPNAFGFATKFGPGYEDKDLYFDGDIVVKASIDLEIQQLKLVLDTKKYQGVVWPLDGIGTGLAAMPQNAPNYLAYLTDQILKLIQAS